MSSMSDEARERQGDRNRSRAWYRCQGCGSSSSRELTDLEKRLAGLFASLRYLVCQACGREWVDRRKAGRRLDDAS